MKSLSLLSGRSTSATRLGAVVLVFAAAGCQPAKVSPPPAPSGKSASLRAMEQVATAAHRCWFASRDPAFRPYRFANELNSFTGQPRFLLVPARDFGGRPLLVVQARGASSRVESFGPLLDEPLGGRVKSDLDRWSRGDTGCTATS